MVAVDGFIGRSADIKSLAEEYDRVRESGRGSLVLLKGRRRVGKSWLVEEFIERAGAPSFFFLADNLRHQLQLDRFAEHLARSTLAAAGDAAGVRFSSWEAALVTACAGARRERPAVIVLDEFPHLVDGADSGVVEASLNAAWERVISRVPVMLVLVGSDFSVMSMLSEHDRPLFDRPTLIRTIQPLNIAEFAAISGLAGAAAIDAFHVVGGFPRLARLWRPGWTLEHLLGEQFADPDAPLVSVGRRILDAEFPGQVQARTVLTVIGAGERTYASIANAADVGSGNLRRSLALLEREKRVITADVPLSAAPSGETRYSVSDPYLRFYLRFIDPSLADIIRGRGASVIGRVQRDWQAYLGKAVEPFVRHSLERLTGDRLFGATRIGGYWTRTNTPKVDLVGVDDDGPPKVRLAGSIKWRANARFTASDANSLRITAVPNLVGSKAGVPGVTLETPLIGVSRSGFAPGHGLSATLGPEDLIAAWHTDSGS
jgi:AAA+ ATPase superfamily predicted ATPase